ncbi:unnamed protein product, partial [Brugia timori]|uniref:tRNA (Guanosine(46)-N7)-methyltransferase TrmB n=1 Tax=Brugia timori TaxID=42155 RepID=A0A0R3Q9F4_9BILA
KDILFRFKKHFPENTVNFKFKRSTSFYNSKTARHKSSLKH